MMTLRTLHSRPLAALALGAILAAGAGCRGNRSPADERTARATGTSGDLVIAAAWPWAERKEYRYGEGLEMAVDEINAAGGVRGRKLRVVRSDDKESVDEGRLLAQRLGADPNVVAVVGHLQSYVTVPAAAIYDISGLVLFSPTTTDPELTSHGYRRVFRGTFSNATVARQMAQLAASRGYRRLAICYIRDAYGRGLANAFEERASELGLSVVGRQSYDPTGQVTTQTFDAIVRELKATDMDALFLAGEVPSAATFIAAARAAGIRVPILGGDALDSPELVTVAGAAAEGTVVASMFHPDEPRPEVRQFADAFRKRYGAEPDAASALGYDAIRLLAHAMRQAKTAAPEDVASALHAGPRWEGVTGPFKFDAGGDLVERPVVKLVVRNGTFHYLTDAQLARAP